MRSSSLLAIRPRRVLAVAGLVSLGSGVLMLTAAAHPVLAAASMQSASPAGYSPAMVSHGRPGKPSRAAVKEFERQVKTQTKHLAAISQSPTTVPGPHMWDPSLNHGKGGPNPNASSVTVSETSNMVDQQIQVSWTNFTP